MSVKILFSTDSFEVTPLALSHKAHVSTVFYPIYILCVPYYFDFTDHFLWIFKATCRRVWVLSNEIEENLLFKHIYGSDLRFCINVLLLEIDIWVRPLKQADRV